jgi:hypothetical protein
VIVIFGSRRGDGGWGLTGPVAVRFGLVDEYLAHLADRNYSPKTVRAYGYDLLAFCRWLADETCSWRSVDGGAAAVLGGLPGADGSRPAGPEHGPAVGWSDGSAPRRRSTGGWLRSRACSDSRRCVTRR